MSLKQAAEELLKIADEIEKEAEEVTHFVCDECNHTATLATINARRAEAAEGADQEVKVGMVTVNDVVSCPACGGNMKYHATEASSQYYFEPAEEKEANVEEGPIDYDSLKRYAGEDEGDDDDDDEKEGEE